MAWLSKPFKSNLTLIEALCLKTFSRFDFRIARLAWSFFCKDFEVRLADLCVLKITLTWRERLCMCTLSGPRLLRAFWQKPEAGFGARSGKLSILNQGPFEYLSNPAGRQFGT